MLLLPLLPLSPHRSHLQLVRSTVLASTLTEYYERFGTIKQEQLNDSFPAMDTTLMSLPTELVATILSQLPLHALLSFSATNLTNRALAQTVLQELNMAVLPRDLYGRLALMEHDADSASLDFSIIKTAMLEKPLKSSSPPEILQRQVCLQNKIATDVLKNECTHSVRILSLHMYDFRSSELASVMANNLSKLRELTLRFCHPYIHDKAISSNYWREVPDGSPCWNALVGLGAENQQNLRLRNLHSLRIERAGLTSTQLRKFVESNPRLKNLHLENVAGVDQEFVQWLGAYCESDKSRLEQITLQNCRQLKMQKLEDFAWLAGIAESSVTYLSLAKCRNVRHEMLVTLIEDEDEDEELRLDTLETIIPPRGPARHYGVAEEVVQGQLLVTMAAGVGGAAKHICDTDKIVVDPQFEFSAETEVV